MKIMNKKNIHNLKKAALHFFLPIAAAGYLLSGTESKAQNYPPICTETYAFPGGSACRGTPTAYFTAIYELGLCKSDPISGGKFDFKSGNCVKTYSADNPSEIDLGSGNDFSLGKIDTFPFGSYSHSYMIVSNRYGYKGRINVPGEGVYSTTGVTLNTSIPGRPGYQTGEMLVGGGENRFNVKVTDFESSMPGCTDIMNTTKLPDDPGTVQAILADSTNQKACGNGTTRIIGSFAFSEPVEITTNATLKVEFNVRNFGIFYQRGGAGGLGVEAVGGPIIPRFRVN